MPPTAPVAFDLNMENNVPPCSATASKFSKLVYALSAETFPILNRLAVASTSGLNCGESPASRSRAAGGETAVDWRNYNIPSTPHYADTLGTTLNGKLVQLVERLGLTYGAIDLVENPQGEFFFLEINSMGQWLWIEDLTELPISMSIARHLASPQLIRR